MLGILLSTARYHNVVVKKVPAFSSVRLSRILTKIRGLSSTTSLLSWSARAAWIHNRLGCMHTLDPFLNDQLFTIQSLNKKRREVLMAMQ